MVGFGRRSRLTSSRGHVRLEQGRGWSRWAAWAVLAGLGVVVLVVVVQQWVLPELDGDEIPSHNRTWLEFAWTTTPVNQEAVERLGERLAASAIDVVYLEASAWRDDGTLLEGEYARDFAEGLRAAYPDVRVLLWLRMSGAQIANADQQAAVVDLANRAVREWNFNGVQMNGRVVYSGDENLIQLLRTLRDTIGPDAMLSVTVPPDRIPTDPEVPIGSSADPELTWDVNYKQRVGLLLIDEIVIMAHASGLEVTSEYERWVAYQVVNYADALDELENPADIIVALPTYDAAPEHDPEVEDVRTAIRGVRASIEQSGTAEKWVKGVGLYEYKTTDSLEWALFNEQWLGNGSD
jgi:hypothetical protein